MTRAEFKFTVPPIKPRPSRAELHSIGVAYGERHWVGTNGKTYATRADWESSVCRYHGAMTV